jgi:branched-chain amino acid aminotransferase
MGEIINYINGEWLSASDSRVSFSDGGFQRGDGLFETIRFQNGRLFKPEKHMKRLHSGLNIIQIEFHKSNTKIISILKEMIRQNNIPSGLLKLMITRGEISGTPWNYTGNPNVYITIRPFTTKPVEPVKVLFYSEEQYPIIRFNPAIKSLNYIGNMLAKKDAEKAGAFEPVFYNRENIITECAIRNIFFIKGKTLITPGLDLGVLPGVMRDTIMELAPQIGLCVVEDSIPFDSINGMEEAFISSTGIGLLSCYWEGWKSKFTMTNLLKKRLDAIITDHINND